MPRSLIQPFVVASLLVLTRAAAAVPITFDISYNRLSGGGGGSASAVAVIDDSIFGLPVGPGPNILSFSTTDGTFDALSSFELTISGVDNPANNGVFTLSDLSSVFFSFSQMLDPTMELFSQFTGSGPGHTFNFSLESTSIGLTGSNISTFQTSGGTQDFDGSFEFARTEFRVASITPRPIPEPSTLCLIGLGVVWLVGRRRA